MKTAAFLLALTASVAAAAPSPSYVALVERYAGGDRAGAVEALGAWPEAEVRREISRLRVWKRRTSLLVFLRFPLRSAVMLHTDRAGLDRDRDRLPSAHGSFARQIAVLLPDRPEDQSFARRWYLAMAWQAQSEELWNEALGWAREGLARFAKDADLQLAAGTLEETLGSVKVVPQRVGRLAINGQERLPDLAGRKARLREAEKALTQALAADPDLEEARLRLGRVWWRLEKPAAAAAALDGVLARSTDRHILYLAHLFRGRLHEEAGSLDEAVASYRAAVALDPPCQTARVALSHGLHRRGDVAESRQVLDPAVGRRGHRGSPDGFWRYPSGRSEGVGDLLEALRAQSQP